MPSMQLYFSATWQEEGENEKMFKYAWGGKEGIRRRRNKVGEEKKGKHGSKSHHVVNLAAIDFLISEIEFCDTVIVEISFTSFIMTKKLF